MLFDKFTNKSKRQNKIEYWKMSSFQITMFAHATFQITAVKRTGKCPKIKEKL